MPKKILFLYLEFAEYTLSTLRKLVEIGAEVHLVQYPIKSEAPYQFDFPKTMKVYDRHTYTNEQLLELCKQINPDLIVCGGWTDSGYLKVCRYFKPLIPTILGMDTQFKGTPKQYLAILISKFTLQRCFTYMTGGGKLQYEYASKLGFKKQNMLPAYYSADYDYFNTLYQENIEIKEKKYPKRFIYVGRYLTLKGVEDLWRAFIELQTEQSNEWELWCLGAGELYETAAQHPQIKHCGFIQNKAMAYYAQNTGVFVMPSHKDAWGVAVHEFSIACFPIICSNKVGAIHSFVQEGKNGYVFQAKNVESLKQAMRKMMQKTDAELMQMGKLSNQLGAQITPKITAQVFYDLACKGLSK
jgi:glycosyltransferase involved in cell wall biosynthesis